jgi:formylglycine-generating enzyme required for sulfatase activity
MPEQHSLKIFLCYAFQDKSKVRELYDQLGAEGWIEPWLDVTDRFPGRNWRTAIKDAIETADNTIMCLSNSSVTRKGYNHREMRYAQEICLDRSEGLISLITLRLEECEVPSELQLFYWIDYFGAQKEQNYRILLNSLRTQFEEKVRKEAGENTSLGSLEHARPAAEAVRDLADEKKSPFAPELPDLHLVEAGKPVRKTCGSLEFVKVSKGKFMMGSQDRNPLAFEDEKPCHWASIPYDFWIGRFPITKQQFGEFIVSARYSRKRSAHWKYTGTHPVINARWKDVQLYLRWLNAHYGDELPDGLAYRLPTEAEWEKAARGVDAREWPWGNEFDRSLCNSSESDLCATTPVGTYSPAGDSPYGCADICGNTWEWTQSLYRPYPYDPNDGREVLRGSGLRVVRGGSFYRDSRLVRCAYRKSVSISKFAAGIRVVAGPPVT